MWRYSCVHSFLKQVILCSIFFVCELFEFENLNFDDV